MLQFTDPVKGVTMIFALIKLSSLQPGRYQRTLSTTFAGKMSQSMQNGFMCPVLVTPAGEDKYEVLDGQHRLYALTALSSSLEVEVPCIILPPAYKDLPLIYNIEKDDNIKDICSKLYQLYIDHNEADGENELETDLVMSSMGMPYYITLSFAHMEFGLESPSLVESVVKKLDRDFFPVPLMDAIDTRRLMAQKAKVLERTVAGIALRFHISDYNLKKSIISKSSMDLWGRARSVAETYEDGMNQLIEKIEATDWSWMAGR